METIQNLQGVYKSIAAIDWKGIRSTSQSPGVAALSPFQRMPKVSVIIPTLNEARNLPLVLPLLPMSWIDEVILVDGRSTDGTVEVARGLLPSIKVIMEKKRGKGAAMKAGYLAAQGDILVVMDADGSNDPREIPKFVMSLMQGADMVKGSRFAPGGGTTDMPVIRRIGNGFFTLSVNLLFGSIWTDLCYGYHAFWRYCLDLFDLTDVDGFEIDTALYLRAFAQDLHVLETPSFEGYRFHGEGKLRTIPDGWRVLKTIGFEWYKNRRRRIRERYLGFRSSLPSAPAFEMDFSALAGGVSSQGQLLNTFGVILSAVYSLNELMARLLQQTVTMLGATSASILILDDQLNLQDGRLYYCGSIQGVHEDLKDVIDNGLVGWVARYRQPAIVEDTGADPRWLRRDWDNHGCGGRSAMVVPITVDEHSIGVLTLVRSNVNRFAQGDLKSLESVLLQM